MVMMWVSFPRHVLVAESNMAGEANLHTSRENVSKSMLGIAVLFVHVSFL